MKILHVIASVDPRGGGPIEGVFSSAHVWLNHGHKRHVACLDAPDAPWVKNCPVTVFALGPRGRIYRFLRGQLPFLRYGYSPRLKSWLKKNASSYDAIVINGLWNYASYGSWRALRGSHVPYFVFTHGMLDPWFNQAYPTKTFFKSIFWKLFEHKVLRDARGVMFTCEEERDLANKSFSPYVAQSYVVGYGARDIQGDPDCRRAAFHAQAPALGGKRFMLFLSRIHPKKGVDLLLEAFARHANSNPDIDLVIAGPDQTGWKSDLEKLAATLGVETRIHWPGMLSGDAKWGAFQSAEFFVLPSHQENFGIVVAEAMALGKPVLITDKVNIWREIKADGAGLVVKDDIAGISDGLRRMLSLSLVEHQAMSANARSSFLSRYDLETNAMRLLELLEQLSAKRGHNMQLAR